MEAQKQSGGEGKSKSQRGAAESQSSQHQQYTYQFQYQYPPHQHHQQQHYGTFQQPSAPACSQPAMGFPRTSPPSGSVVGMLPYAAAGPGPGYYPQGYQPVSGYAVVAEGRPTRLHRNSVLCCGIGIGWILFIAGFFFAAIPWYVGAFIFFCVGVDHKEKPGLLACTIAALIAAVAILLGLTNGTARW